MSAFLYQKHPFIAPEIVPKTISKENPYSVELQTRMETAKYFDRMAFPIHEKLSKDEKMNLGRFLRAQVSRSQCLAMVYYFEHITPQIYSLLKENSSLKEEISQLKQSKVIEEQAKDEEQEEQAQQLEEVLNKNARKPKRHFQHKEDFGQKRCKQSSLEISSDLLVSGEKIFLKEDDDELEGTFSKGFVYLAKPTRRISLKRFLNLGKVFVKDQYGREFIVSY